MSEQKNETQNQTAAPAAPVEAPAPKLASGLFQGFRLGATLEQSEHGNVMHGMKPNMMDYVKNAENKKNQTVSAEDLSKIAPVELDEGGVKKSDSVKVPSTGKVQIGGPSRKIGVTPKAVAAAYGTKKSLSDEEIAAVPTEQRDLILAELDRKIEEAKKSNDAAEAERIEKAKEKAKKCWAPTMEYKQPKSE